MAHIHTKGEQRAITLTFVLLIAGLAIVALALRDRMPWSGETGTTTSVQTAPVPPEEAGRITGTVLLRPNCPVQRIPPDPACVDKPYTTELQVVRGDGSVVATFDSGTDGAFDISVPAGEYSIRAASGTAFPRCSSGAIHVVAGETADAPTTCDTGIR